MKLSEALRTVLSGFEPRDAEDAKARDIVDAYISEVEETEDDAPSWDEDEDTRAPLSVSELTDATLALPAEVKAKLLEQLKNLQK